MTTQAEAIKGAAECFAEAYLILYDPANSDQYCAEKAWTPTYRRPDGQPGTLADLTAQIAAWRDEHGIIRRDQAREEA